MSLDFEGGAGSRTALTRLITVSDSEFASEYWGRTPLLSRASDLHEEFADLFSLAAVDELVANRAIRTPFVRMANEGNLLAASRYTGSSGFGAEVSDQLDADKVLAEFAGGATLVLQGLHRTWEPLREFTRRLVAELGHPAQVNAYITPASSQGFSPHYDVHDVFVIQIHGEKRWSIHEPVYADPLEDQPWSDRSDAVAARAKETPAIDAVFAPGDVLYLPRGWIHSAVAQGGTTVHLTIGMPALNRWDIVQQLVEELRQDPELRSSLPIGSDFAADVSATAAALAERLTTRDFTASVESRLARKLRRSTRPEPVLPISTVEVLAHLAGDQPVRWREGIDARITADDGSVRIEALGKTVTLPAEASDAIEGLLDGGVAGAGELVGLDSESSIVVARRLLREGILVLA